MNFYIESDMNLKSFSENDYVIAKKFLEVVENHVKTHYYCIVINRTKIDKTTNFKKHYTLQCDRSDEFKRMNNFKKFRKINNIKCDCFFRTRITYYKSTEV